MNRKHYKSTYDAIENMVEIIISMTIKFEDFDVDDILIDKKSYEKKFIFKIDAISLCIRFNRWIY